MQILYTINKRDDINIYNKKYNQKKEENDLIENKWGKFYNIENGSNDFYYVKNYNLTKILKIKDYDEILSLKNMGFEIDYDEDFYNQNYVSISKVHDIRHVVKPLETLYGIAQIYGIDKNQIIFNNKLKSEKLFIGQILFI